MGESKARNVWDQIQSKLERADTSVTLVGTGQLRGWVLQHVDLSRQ